MAIKFDLNQKPRQINLTSSSTWLDERQPMVPIIWEACCRLMWGCMTKVPLDALILSKVCLDSEKIKYNKCEKEKKR